SKAELLKIADEEARHLNELIEDAVEMGRLDTANIQLETEPSNVGELVREVVASMHNVIDGRPLNMVSDEHTPAVPVDRKLVKLAIKQLLDNALKYSP